MRRYSETAVDFLQLQQTPELINGAPVIIKKSPSEPRPGYLDRHELQVMLDSQKAKESNPTRKPATPAEEIQAIRDAMGYPNLNLCTVQMYTGYETLPVNGSQVGLWSYYPRSIQYQTSRPCLIFFHGGGWVGGTPFAVENACRLISQLADAVVFNVDYSLAPEKKYPSGFHDCVGAVAHIHSNAKAYGIDPKRIAVGGDSAGGNLAAAVAMKDRDAGTHMISLQVLLYACVTMFSGSRPETPDYTWDLSQYEIAPEQQALIDPCLGISRPPESGENEVAMASLLFEDPARAAEVTISPLLAKDFANLPRALSVSCEFDGLRIQDELYAKRLYDAGVPVKTIRYRGTTHAIIDRLGFEPQTEDMCLEIAAAIRDM